LIVASTRIRLRRRLKPWRHDSERDWRAWRMWREGMTQAQIGAALGGISGQRVSQLLQRHRSLMTSCPWCGRYLPPVREKRRR
jgi:hypothetical protein